MSDDVQRQVGYATKIANELSVRVPQVASTMSLLAEGGTVPFISRYRKEATGSLDEVAITAIRDRLVQLTELDKRRETIIKTIDDQGKLTDKLRGSIDNAETLAALEDLYLPYKPKRRTRATIAREKGLEPLAEAIFEQDDPTLDPMALAKDFIDPEKEVANEEEALAGARDIVAEWIAEDQTARAKIRRIYENDAVFRTKVITGKEEEGAKFKDYFDMEEAVKTAPSHRVLAMRRGETELVLTMRIVVEEELAISALEGLFVRSNSPAGDQVKLAARDSYKRLLSPSMETEVRLATKKRADEGAISVFADNLRKLLLAAPMGQKGIIALDPGFRTGCKLVVLDPQGKLLLDDVIYPHTGAALREEAGVKLMAYCQKFGVQAVAIGNGTAGRETESFVRELKMPNITVVMVNESGASVYSASEVAREEFPDKDLTVRGAVSIGRRLADPLAELVKLDPKSIGVGQYQHDVDQPALKRSLDDVVVSCVNSVGVELNTASKQLLSYVSGLGSTLAQNIIDYRNENGAFASRAALKKVPRLGPKAFEQAAGFLRIRDGAKNPLDASGVHPESYSIVDTMAKDLGCSVQELMQSDSLRKQINLEKYVTETVGLPTLEDIIKELAKPGRDPREKFEVFEFAEGVEKMEDLQEDMVLPGIVTNVTAFGAFVDVGVHQDGLVHISQLSDTFVNDPKDVVQVHQKVMARVLEIDIPRKRISLSLKTGQRTPGRKAEKSNDRGNASGSARYSRHPGPGKPKSQSKPKKFGSGLNIQLKGGI